ncbi:hypothetical protein ADUPG1_011149 [Aduncisulcus paluster]|uniref:Uncharacterized protein n=1 Tax=Aduncisulcus paluster TaxID=2918883 RepID=A0ABQ5JUI3_9EUKA|nr:hypothetical protein ADUPG1_011149 [Aduncisulcus paluster]
MSSPTSTRSDECPEFDVQIVKAEFFQQGDADCLSIPRDSPIFTKPDFPNIKASDTTRKKGHVEYDRSSKAQDMIKGQCFYYFTNISIPFSSPVPIKGVLICLERYNSPPKSLIFAFTSSKKETTIKKYELPEFEEWAWFSLPVDLSDVVLCEITGKGRDKEYFNIKSLAFFREETPEEIVARKSRETAREKLWSEAIVEKPEFVREGDSEAYKRYSMPIPCDDPTIIAPSLSMVKGKDDSYCQESRWYDVSLDVQQMLKVEPDISMEEFLFTSHLSIPFPSPSPMKGAYICVNEDHSSPCLLFTFTLSNGTRISKKYEFSEPEYEYEWYFLPIDLLNVVLCEIEGKGQWEEKNRRTFCIYSLIFTMPREIVAGNRLSLLPWELSKGDDVSEEEEEEEEEEDEEEDEYE